jgi:hypothetical protein
MMGMTRFAPYKMLVSSLGCLGGNTLSLAGNENHVRVWNQPVPGSKYGAWFFTASYETACVDDHGKLETFQKPGGGFRLHLGFYHCVGGGPGTYHVRHPSGYDDGAKDFATSVVNAARQQGWSVSLRVITRPVPKGGGTGEDGVRFSGKVYVLTVTAKTPEVVSELDANGAAFGAVRGQDGRIWIDLRPHDQFAAVNPATRAVQTYTPPPPLITSRSAPAAP